MNGPFCAGRDIEQTMMAVSAVNRGGRHRKSPPLFEHMFCMEYSLADGMEFVNTAVPFLMICEIVKRNDID